MDDQFFAETADPKEIADGLGLTILGWLDGQLYARGRDQLYQIGPFRPQANYSGPADLRICFREAWSHDWTYVGEQFHTPREGAEHAGLTVIGDDDFSGGVFALDGFGRKYVVEKTGNGPMAKSAGWASDAEMQRWAPQHRPRGRTTT